MSIFTGIWNGIKKFFSGGYKALDKVALAITEGVKQAMISGVLGFVADILDTLTKSKVPTEIVTLIKNNIDKIIAVELGIEGLPQNPTEADILAFEQRVLAAFNLVDDKSKLYTTLAAQIYGLIQPAVAGGKKLTFAQIVAIVEQSYQDYLQDQQETSA